MKAQLIMGYVVVAVMATPASAVPVITSISADLTKSPFSFTYLGNVFSFGSTGDLFNPLSVQNRPPSATGSFGGFLGIPVQPTSNFVDRGVVTFGPADRFATFSSPTTVPFSLGDNFIGLRATSGGQDYFGFAFTTNATLNSIGFETVAGQQITATTAIPAAVPEISTWAMLVFGFGVLGASMRYRRRHTSVSFA